MQCVGPWLLAGISEHGQELIFTRVSRGKCHATGESRDRDVVKPNDGIGAFLKFISPRSPECAGKKALVGFTVIRGVPKEDGSRGFFGIHVCVDAAPATTLCICMFISVLHELVLFTGHRINNDQLRSFYNLKRNELRRLPRRMFPRTWYSGLVTGMSPKSRILLLTSSPGMPPRLFSPWEIFCTALSAKVAWSRKGHRAEKLFSSEVTCMENFLTNFSSH